LDTSKTLQMLEQFLAGIYARLERNKGLGQFSDQRVRLANHGRLNHCRVLHQSALHFERPHRMSGSLDNVVDAADEPEVAVLVTFGWVAGDIPTTDEAFVVTFFIMQVAWNIEGQPGLSAS
jgi:hypothetical protein